jgi:hypothetical protein
MPPGCVFAFDRVGSGFHQSTGFAMGWCIVLRNSQPTHLSKE